MMYMNMITIGNRIKIRREQLGLSQEEFGEAVGLKKIDRL